MEHIIDTLTATPDPTWAIPGIAVGVAALAFLLGRSLLASRSGPPTKPNLPEDDPTYLAGVTRDRRSTQRRQGNLVEVEIAGDSEDLPDFAWVLDRSVGGLRLLVDQPVAERARLEIRPRHGPTTQPWTPILVKSCSPDGDRWELGCQFQQMPSYNTLLLFG